MQLLEEQTTRSGVAISNILYATDFSTASDSALPYVTALTLRYGSTVHLLHVLPDAVVLRPGAPDPALLGSIYEEAHSAAQEKIQQVAAQFRGFAVRTHVRHGEISEVVKQMIYEQEIDLLVLGTHGRTGLGKLLMGSVAETLFREAACPVLTVGPLVPTTEQAVESRHHREISSPRVKFRQILYATDFKADAAEHVNYAVSLAREYQSRLLLLHVIDGFGKDLHDHPGPIDRALSNLEELVPGCEGLRYKPELKVSYGTPEEQILYEATECQADLIVLGLRPVKANPRPSTHFGHSVAHKVVVGAYCPVLTVRS